MSRVETIFRVVDLKKLFPIKRRRLFRGKQQFIHAVDGVSFEVKKGETFGIVGESGCGKTTLARLILQLEEPTSGKIFFKDQDITSLNRAEMKRLRRQMQMIFQDPYSSLDPRKNVLNIIAEPLRVHKISKNSSIIKEKVQESLRLVDLPTSESFLVKMPDGLSGGERQRVGVARALILGVEFIVADEPVSMLDASVKAGITSLMMGLKQKIGLTYIFITHEIGLAYYICDRIAVMYLGKIVELGNTEEIIKVPLHPYTRLLMEAVPPLQPDEKWGATISERRELPLSTEPPSGCRFHPRCTQVQSICEVEEPAMIEVMPKHYVACHYT